MNRLRQYVLRKREAFDEWLLGIDTSEIHPPLDPARPEFRGYAPVSFADWRIIRSHIRPQGAFIDYGSGLGRVVILAAQMPFRRVIGVEFDSALVERAQQNVDRTRKKAPIELITADAATYPVPSDATAFFFNNPFTGTILISVLQQIRSSWLASPRRVTIYCSIPVDGAFEKDIRAADWLTLQLEKPLSNGQRKLLIFTPLST